MITEVRITKKAEKDLRKIPKHLIASLKEWILKVQMLGLEEVRKQPGYHDEPLQGKRDGQRSIRLNRAYRMIYEIVEEKNAEQNSTVIIKFISIEEVNKHEY